MALQIFYLRKTLKCWKHLNILGDNIHSKKDTVRSEAVNGASTIKAFGRMEEFYNNFIVRQNQCTLKDSNHSGVW